MSPELLLYGFVIFIVLYIAYLTFKIITKTVVLMIISGITYLGMVYLEYLNYQMEHLLLTMASVGTLYIVWQMVSIPGKVIDKIS